MKLEKTPPYVTEVFEAALAKTAGTRRLMFGSVAGFRNGHMFSGTFGKNIFVRLAESDREQLLAQEGAEPFSPMPGRPMREYVVVPPEMLEDDSGLQAWVTKAFEYVGSLPPKGEKRAPRTKKSAPPKNRPRTSASRKSKR